MNTKKYFYINSSDNFNNLSLKQFKDESITKITFVWNVLWQNY